MLAPRPGAATRPAGRIATLRAISSGNRNDHSLGGSRRAALDIARDALWTLLRSGQDVRAPPRIATGQDPRLGIEDDPPGAEIGEMRENPTRR